jgi:hypothetical protein
VQEASIAAHMATSSHQFALKHCRDMLVIYNTEYSLLLKELTEVNSMHKQFSGDDDMEQETSEWREDVRGRIKELKEKKRKIQEEEELLRNKKQKPLYYKEQPRLIKSVTVPKAANTVTIDTSKAADDNSTLTESTSPAIVPQRTMEERSAALQKIVNGNLSMSQGVDVDKEESALKEAEVKAMARDAGVICTHNANSRFMYGDSVEE